MSTTLDHRRSASTPAGVCDHANLNARWDATYGSYAECEDCGHRENPEGGAM